METRLSGKSLRHSPYFTSWLEALESRSLLSVTLPTTGAPGPVTVTGTTGADQFIIRQQPGTAANVQISTDNGQSFSSVPLANVTQFNVISNGGADTLTLDASNGFLGSSSVPINFNGGGLGSVLLSGNPIGVNGVTTTATYNVGQEPGSGQLQIQSGAIGSENLLFTNTAGVLDAMPGANLVVNGTTARDLIQVRDGAGLGSQATTEVVVDSDVTTPSGNGAAAGAPVTGGTGTTGTGTSGTGGATGNGTTGTNGTGTGNGTTNVTPVARTNAGANTGRTVSVPTTFANSPVGGTTPSGSLIDSSPFSFGTINSGTGLGNTTFGSGLSSGSTGGFGSGGSFAGSGFGGGSGGLGFQSLPSAVGGSTLGGSVSGSGLGSTSSPPPIVVSPVSTGLGGIAGTTPGGTLSTPIATGTLGSGAGAINSTGQTGSSTTALSPALDRGTSATSTSTNATTTNSGGFTGTPTSPTTGTGPVGSGQSNVLGLGAAGVRATTLALINQSNLTINTNGGDDLVVLDGRTPAAGLQGIVVNGSGNNAVLARLSTASTPNVAATGFVRTDTGTAATIDRVYQETLHRQASAGEVNAWMAAQQQVGAAAVTRSIAESPEAHAALIERLFQYYLGRTPSAAESTQNVSFLNNGQTEETIIASILGTSEYQKKVGAGGAGTASDQAYVSALYQNLLGRSASASDINNWTALVPIVGRTAIADAFVQSNEFRTNAVADFYPTLLLRNPDPAGVNNLVNSPADLLTIRDAMLQSPEFFQGAATGVPGNGAGTAGGLSGTGGLAV